MMSKLIAALMLMGLVPLIAGGQGEKAVQAMMDAASSGVDTVISMAGAFMVFCGLMEVLKRAGAVRFISRVIEKPLKKLLGKDAQEAAMGDVVLNLASNMLGLGNAATPAGISAAKKLAKDGEMTDALCMFLVLNASSVQLFPTTVIALRAMAGSSGAADIVLPTLIATACSTLAGIVSCKMVERFTRCS